MRRAISNSLVRNSRQFEFVRSVSPYKSTRLFYTCHDGYSHIHEQERTMSSYQHLKATDIFTKQVLGYVGTNGFEWAALVPKAQASMLKFENRDGKRALAKETSPSNRWLGEGEYQYADWGLGKNYVWIDWKVDGDGTICMAEDETRKLYWYEKSGIQYICWTKHDEAGNKALLKFELEDAASA
jgi:hypothetical protein